MPLDTIYLTRHGHRLNYTIDPRTGTYKSAFPTPTGSPVDPCLTSHGVQQSHELAAHLAGESLLPKPGWIYSSPFYRCLQTIRPGVEMLRDGRDGDSGGGLDVRLENGIGEWFGPTSYFTHPSPSTPTTMRTHFPTLLPPHPEQFYTPHLHPSQQGETIAQLHDRLATTLTGIITDLDTEIEKLEAGQQPEERSSKAVLIVSHAAPLIAMGRALTGNMPDDSGTEDFNVFTAGLSTFVRRTRGLDRPRSGSRGEGVSLSGGRELLAPGTRFGRSDVTVPDWQGGRGVGGGWDCVSNGDCSFLSGGAERGWHFNGEESFDIPPMPAPLEGHGSASDSPRDMGTKL